MSSHSIPTPFKGIIPPMVTPLLAPDQLDYAGIERLVEHILGGGVHGLFILGTTGEGPSLSFNVRRDLISAVCKQVGDRVPVLAGITDTAFGESIAIARHAANAGVTALVVAPPPYFATSQAELLAYLKRLAGDLPLPLLLYNMPSHTKVFIEAATVRAAAEISGIVGLKDSSGNMTYFHTVRTLLHGRQDFSLLVGPEELLAETVLLGGHGGVNGGANLAPALYVSLYEAACAGDLARVRELHARVMLLSTQLYTVGQGGMSMLRGLKCALALNGLCNDAMAEPFARFEPAERRMIAGRLQLIFPEDNHANSAGRNGLPGDPIDNRPVCNSQ